MALFILTAGVLVCPHGAGKAEEENATAEIPLGSELRAELRLIVRGDDIGCSHAANVACIKSYREGIVTSVEVMVPCPWFEEAVKMLNENPGLDVGVHLTLTSEWDNFKWRPLTHAPSLVNADGYFYPQTREWNRWPRGTGFYDANPKAEEVERELRAQIELAMKKVNNVTHISAHMGAATCRPDLRAITKKLAKEYGLLTHEDLKEYGAEYAKGMGSGKDKPTERAAALVRTLESLKPGLWIIVEHPGMDFPEMRAMGHRGYEFVANDRDGVTKAFTSKKVKQVIKRRRIKLLSYGDFKK